MPSLYVHVPFCIKKCDYCAFYSIDTASQSLVKRYLESLELEIYLRQQSTDRNLFDRKLLECKRSERKPKVSSLFIGGGTPTALNAEELDILLDTLQNGYEIEPTAEQTIEGNPGTLTPEKMVVLKKHRINRISLGAQTLDDCLLKRIGRIHSTEEIYQAVRLVREAGFTNLNLDLMFGLPGQTLLDWQRTLENAIQLQPEHVSVYGLMIEEGTPLAFDRERLSQLSDDDLQAEMYDTAKKVLAKAGYHHYETSNFALPGYECRHNLGYWRGSEYYGVGPGAVSFLGNRRSKNREDLDFYIAKLAKGELPVDTEEDEILSGQEQMSERIILALRLAEGLDLNTFEKDFGQKITDIYPGILERYLKEGILFIENGSLIMKEDFWFVANSILREFVFPPDLS